MTLESFFPAIAALSGLMLVMVGILAMGLSPTMAQIRQPLRAARLLIAVTEETEDVVASDASYRSIS